MHHFNSPDVQKAWKHCILNKSTDGCHSRNCVCSLVILVGHAKCISVMTPIQAKNQIWCEVDPSGGDVSQLGSRIHAAAYEVKV
eukprot:1153532-Pelagomonas_calceolata.AAC.7